MHHRPSMVNLPLASAAGMARANRRVVPLRDGAPAPITITGGSWGLQPGNRRFGMSWIFRVHLLLAA
jgi:hypothetical protein